METRNAADCQEKNVPSLENVMIEAEKSWYNTL